MLVVTEKLFVISRLPAKFIRFLNLPKFTVCFGSHYLRFSVRISFLNHLHEWKQRTMQSAHSQVRDKSEELASELDLRLHLHAPRSRRIEIDVKNVRAGEQERVYKACLGLTSRRA